VSWVRLYAALLAVVFACVPLATAATTDKPAEPMITGKPSNPSNQSNPTFKFSDGSGATFVCQLDGGAFSTCTSPKTYDPLDEGEHTFAVKAVNANGESDPASYTWAIDTEPPELAITHEPSDPSGVSTAHFEFSATDKTSLAFQCGLDNSAFQACSTPPGQDYSDLTNARHTFTLEGTDAAGNESTTHYSWLVDTARPVVTIDPASTPPNPTNQTGASFRFSSNKDPSTFRCKLDANAFSTCTSPKTYGQLGEGTHVFSVRATDSLDHQGPATTFSWTIDLTPPAAPSIDSGPANPTDATTASFVFSDSEAGVTFGCQVDGSAFSTCTSSAAYSGLAAGAHTFAVHAIDPAGNTGAAASYAWTVKDTKAPGDVGRLERKVGYRNLKLTWSRPPDADFDYVRVLDAKGAARGKPRTLVYKGSGTRYTDRRFENGVYHRYAIISYDHAGNASRGISVAVRPSALLRFPRDGAFVHGPPRLVWDKVANATFYNVQLYLRGRKILSAWPSVARLALRRRWVYSGRSFRLTAGMYSWYVWPAFGPRAKSHYGHLLGQSGFRVGGVRQRASRASVEKARSRMVESLGACKEFARETKWPPLARP
jgi:hypothetical protein